MTNDIINNLKEAEQEYASTFLGLREIAKNHNVQRQVLTGWLLAKGYTIENRRALKSFNIHYFDEIDTEEKAYWLGFLYADGSVNTSDKTCTKPNRLTINLSSKDRIILEKFAKSIESNLEIEDYIPNGQTYSQNPMSRLCVNSTEFCSYLIEHGCIPNKTFILKMPQLSNDLMRHFIRGFFDGDGCFESGKHFMITKTESILNDMNNIISAILNIEHGKIYYYKNKDSRICDLKFFKQDSVKKIYYWLYDDATIYLERKKDKFKLI
nr:MAG TPA: endonuclease [Crassvirales sp.]